MFWYNWHETLFGDGVKDREKENMLDRIIMPHAFIFWLKFVFGVIPVQWAKWYCCGGKNKDKTSSTPASNQ